MLVKGSMPGSGEQTVSIVGPASTSARIDQLPITPLGPIVSSAIVRNAIVSGAIGSGAIVSSAIVSSAIGSGAIVRNAIVGSAI